MRRQAKAPSAGSTMRQANGLGRFGVAPVCLLALLIFWGIGASTALAGTTRAPLGFSPLDGSGSSVTITEPGQIAIDEATGNVFLNDGREGDSRTVILGAEGAAPAALASPFELGGFCFDGAQNGMAFDDSPVSPNQGTLYVVNGCDNTVKKFTRNPISEQYEPAGELTVEVTSDFRLFGATVDADGNLFVSTGFNNSVVKFDPAGTEVARYDLASSVGVPGSSLAVDSAGDLFVTTLGPSGPVYKYPANAFGEIDPSVFVQVPPTPSSVAVDRAANKLYVALSNPSRVAQYDATTLTKEFEFGVDSLSGEAFGVAVNSATDRIYVSNRGGDNVVVFGPPVPIPDVTTKAASGVTGSQATLNGTVNPANVEVTDCFFEYGPTTAYGSTEPCQGAIPTDSNDHAVNAALEGLESNGATYHFRIVVDSINGPVKGADRTFVTANTVFTEPATAIGITTATLNGIVRPEGEPLTNCIFEYKLRTDAGYEEVPCAPEASEIEADFTDHPVSASLSGLQPNSTYEFRLVATNSEGTTSGEVLTFSTLGPPQIIEIRASGATQSSVTVEGKINPSGFGTSYRFEWGPTTSYGHQVPAEFEPSVGEGHVPIRVSAKLTGLTAGSTYHYRIVAASSAGTTTAPDQIAETLNSCGLPEQRCFELVSRSDAGPVAIPGEFAGSAEMHFQAAGQGGGLAYAVESGYPDATKGAEVLYRGTRAPAGWSSTQLSSPIVAQSEQGESSATGVVQFLSDDLACGFQESFQPLTSDPATKLAREYGGSNLYRINPDGSRTAVSNLAPENPESPGPLINYNVAWAAQDCGKVLFESRYRYPGIPTKVDSGIARLYEWDEGTLRNVGVVPGPSGDVVVAATAGTGTTGISNSQNTVSEDGSRVFFTANRQTSPNPAEIGSDAIFVREDGSTTRDLSLSETATPDEGATYQWANPDGSKVFFTANAGLTADSSSQGPDLYSYDLESEELTDLTPYEGADGARVAGFIAASEDGSRVYFASPNRLVSGRGSSLAENQSEETLSIYEASDGEFSYVGAFSKTDFQSVTVSAQRESTSRTSPDGRYLLFESSADVTGYHSGGAAEAYLYDAEAGAEATICVSCRQDGQPSVALSAHGVLPAGVKIANILNGPQFLTMRGGEPQVFFSSPNKLAPGAVEGQDNIYEWSHGQVFRLVSALPGGGTFATFAGASADGTDAYLSTPETLNWEDGDERISVYVARVGGGFPEPPAPPPACEPTVEGSCQSPSSQGASTPGAASKDFSGPGNLEEPENVNPCKRSARQAQSLSARAKAVRLERKADKLAKRAQRASKQAKKCKRQRANDNRRAGK